MTLDTPRRRVSPEAPLSPRAWRSSLLIAAALVGTGLVLSATINPLLGPAGALGLGRGPVRGGVRVSWS